MQKWQKGSCYRNKGKMMYITEKEQKIYEQFKKLDREAVEDFEPYRNLHTCGDTWFSLMYAWYHRFHYVYRVMENCIVVLEKGIDERVSCILLKKKGENIDSVVKKLYDMFQQAEMPLYFEYVGEEDIGLYQAAAERLGKTIKISSREEDSDYIYRTDAFIAMNGKENKGKRGDINVLLRQYPDIHLKYYDGVDEQVKKDCMAVFEEWCSLHICDNCFYGCEKEACFRMFDIFDPSCHKIAVSYAVGKPLSFAMSERINEEMVCYYFQKNGKRTRGLTYWLNREMALLHQDVTYINLGEDMGFQGLREDKSSLHPCEMKKKCWIEVQ